MKEKFSLIFTAPMDMEQNKMKERIKFVFLFYATLYVKSNMVHF